MQAAPVTFSVHPVGTVDMNGGQPAVHVFPEHAEGLRGLYPGEDIWVLTYRTGPVPADGPRQALGVFATHVAGRPNPIDFLRARITEIQPELGILRIQGYDGEEGAPVLDIRPASLPLRPLT